MKWQFSARYVQDVDTVMRNFVDPEFHRRKLAAIGSVEHEVLSVERDHARFSIRVRRKTRLEGEVPAFLRAAASSAVTVVHEDSWNLGSRCGEVKFEMVGIPVRVHCHTRLTENAGGCLQLYDWEIEARVPVVGRQVEKILVADLEHKLQAETAAIRELLDHDYRPA